MAISFRRIWDVDWSGQVYVKVGAKYLIIGSVVRYEAALRYLIAEGFSPPERGSNFASFLGHGFRHLAWP